MKWSAQPAFARRRLAAPIWVATGAAALLGIYLAVIQFVVPSHRPSDVECLLAYCVLAVAATSHVVSLRRRSRLREYVLRCRCCVCERCGRQLVDAQNTCPECGIDTTDVQTTWERWLGKRAGRSRP